MFKWINKKRNKKGFTLVELVVVIAILGVLAAIAVPKLTTSRTSAANSSHNANVRILEGAASMFMAEKGIPKTQLIWSEDTETDITSGDKLGWGPYLQKWPSIPKGGEVDSAGKYIVNIAEDTGTIEVKPIAVILP